MPGLLYADDFVLWGELEEDLRAMVERFPEVCRTKDLKVRLSKSKERVVKGEEGLEHEVRVDGMQLEYVSEFKYLGCVTNESGTHEEKCGKKVVGRRKAGGAIRSLVNDRDM